MFRTFTVALSSTYTSIWDLLIAGGFINNIGEMLVSSVKNNAIISDRVNMLDVRPADANTGDVYYRDQQADPGTEQVLGNMSKRSNRNSICLRDYKFMDATGGDALVVEIESV
jgi:hypothetical protein